jgi:NADH dehydrogenase
VEINGTEIIPTNTLVWATGVEANPCVAELNVEKDKLGRVHVNEYLQLTKYPKVFVLGDCAHYIDPNSGEPISPRAHNAVRQAKSVADNIIALLRLGEKRRFNYTDSAEVISLGRSRALLRIRYSWIHGFIAIMMFVLSYSILTVGAKNRLRLIIDWILARIYGPDITLVK